MPSLLALPNAETHPDRNVPTNSLSESALESLIDPSRIPRHIAIVMDGNGRWASQRNLPRIEGHRNAVKSVWEIVDECGRLHVEVLTLYAFSSENWKRPPQEVHSLMQLLRDQLRKETPRLHQNNVQLCAIGELARLPFAVRWELERSMKHLKNNTGLRLNLALSYGGRQEIVQAAKRLAEDVRKRNISPDDVSEELFSQYLYTTMLPDPDLVVRTSGEERLSNFLLWQCAYSELYFTPVLWPDFRKRHLFEAVVSYQRRERRFGGLTKSRAHSA